MNIKEKFSSISLNIFNYDFYVYKVINDNDTWYEIIAIKDNKEYYVCKLDYNNTKQGIQTFLLKDLANYLKQRYIDINFKVLKTGIKVNNQIFRLKDSCYYSLKIDIIDYIVNLTKQRILAM